MSGSVFTIGHSNRSIDALLALLQQHRINAIADVRSQPYSKLYPQFDRDALDVALYQQHIRYSFLGKELGARSTDPAAYASGRVRYDKLAASSAFEQGLKRIQSGILHGYRIAILCAEKEPLECHRAILVSRHLLAKGIAVHHIIDENRMETHQELTQRLLQSLSLDSMHLFKTPEQVLQMAYEIQGERIAFVRKEN